MSSNPVQPADIYPKGTTLKDRLRLKREALAALQLLAPELKNAIAAFDGRNPEYPETPSKKHVACPVHGGQDGFRLFDDAEESGGGVCNTCGSFADAPRLLGWLIAYREHGDIPADFDKNNLKDDPYIVRAREELWHYVKTKKALNPDIQAAPARQVYIMSDEERAAKEAKEREKNTWTMNLAAKMFGAAKPFDDKIAAYFRGRGLDTPVLPSGMSLHAGTPYFISKDVPPVFYPTLLMPVVIGSLSKPQVKAMHRIYLEVHPDGRVTKAPVPDAKKILSWSDYSGAAIRLYPLKDSRVLILAEGPETAVSLHSLTKLPTWSCINAGNMAMADIPDQVDTVLIAEDYDVSETGQKASQKLAERVRAMGKLAFIVSPKEFYDLTNPAHKKGIDWDDAIKSDHKRSFALWEPYLGYGRDVPVLGSLDDTPSFMG